MKQVPREDRFWAHINKRGPIHPVLRTRCWIYNGGTTKSGYGNFWNGERLEMAHRYGYRIQKGPIPEGLDICHHCDDPPCVRGAHLFAGTKRENAADMIAKGRRGIHRSNPLFGEDHQNHTLSSADVRAIRALREEGLTLQAIADSFGCSFGTVGRIARGEARRNG